jgi:acyl-CoA thioester hydrolase
MSIDFSQLNLIFETQIPTRWGDQDSYAHINNAVYFRLFEEARVQWLAELGLRVEASGDGPVIAHTEASYFRPIEYPSTVICRCYTAEPGNSSLPFYHALSTTDAPDTIFTTGFVRIVWINHLSGKPVPLPVPVRQAVLSAQTQSQDNQPQG